MGISWSSRRRNNYYNHNLPPYPLLHHHHHHSHPPPPPPPPPPPHQYFSSPQFYTTEPSSLPQAPPPPPPPVHNYVYTNTSTPYPPAHNNVYTSHPLPPINIYAHSSNSMMGRFNYHPYYANQSNGWTPTRPPVGQVQSLTVAPPPYVEHQNAKKVRNDVNIHKDTLKVVVDEQNPDYHLLSFVFDALFDGSITIYYFAKEESNCTFDPILPEAFKPVKIPFQKGLGQKFRQTSGTGIDLGFFALDDLSKPSPEDAFPLVISAETCLPAQSTETHADDSMSDTSPNLQITQAVLEKNSSDLFMVRVIRQILWIDGVRYELHEIYGLGSSAAADFEDNNPGEDCVICMTEPKDTAVLPCRHMCMCSECAKELRLQTNKCPICRQPIEALIEIKINNVEQ